MGVASFKRLLGSTQDGSRPCIVYERHTERLKRRAKSQYEDYCDGKGDYARQE